jgi:tetratricopeptide (TPR) repeat protein
MRRVPRTLVSHFAFVLLATFLAWQPAASHEQQRDKPGQTAGAGYVEQGIRLSEENKWPEAIEAFKYAIRADPRSAVAFGGLGDAYLNTGKWEEALTAYKEAVRFAPTDPVAQYNLGYCYNTMGRHGEAFAPLVKATILDPGFADAYYGIGYAYLRGSQYEKAISFLKSAIRLDPNYAEAYYGLALAYTRLGKVSLAEEPRKKLLTLDAKLVAKLDKEIQTPPQSLTLPLPSITPAKSVASVTKDGRDRSLAPNPPVQKKQQPGRAEAPAVHIAADSRQPTANSETIRQKQAVDAVANDKVSISSTQQSTAEANVRVGQDPRTASQQLLPPGHEPTKQVPAVQPPSLSASMTITPVEDVAPPAPSASLTPPSAPIGVTVWPAKAKRWALVIGVDNYSEQQISKLNGTANDARILAEALVSYAGFPANQVILLSSDQPSQLQPRRSTILRYLSNLRGLVPKDGLLLVSFDGHGIERNGRSYLLPTDALAIDDPSLLEDTAINVSRVKDLIRAAEVTQVVLVLDACRNDPAPGRGQADNLLTDNFSKSFAFDSNKGVTAFATLYATAVGQRAYEYGLKKQGYFTWAIVEGLSGAAANDKGEVTLGSLVKYVQDSVPKYVHRDLGPDKQQRPFAVIEGYNADELVIARTKKAAP